ncbi:MAG: hypothetical protein WD826_02445 [Actinomycetota bacterium]
MRAPRGFGRTVLIGILAGLIVSVGLLVVDTEARRWRWPAASDVRLVDQAAPRQNVTFRAPHRWELDELSENVYLIADGRRGHDRTMLVQTGKTPFTSIQKRLPELNGGRYLDYRPLATRRTRVDSHDALHHSFIGDSLEHLQMWIEHDKGVVRVEFTFRPAEGDDAIELSRRVIETLDIA